jgi:hypothetical protein
MMMEAAERAIPERILDCPCEPNELAILAGKPQTAARCS